MALKEVKTCPVSVQEWFNSAKSCENSDQYHCLRNEYSATVAGCIAPIWVEKGYCPVFNSRASKLDTEKCQSECPNEYYRSFDLYKYPGCSASKRSNLELQTFRSVEENNDTSQTSLQSNTGSSTSILAIVLPVVFGLICLIAVLAWFFYRRYNKVSKEALKKSGGIPETIPLHQQDDKNTEVNQFSMDCLMNKMNIKEVDLVWDKNLVDSILGTLLKHKIIALCGQWGSGRRTLAVQTALELEKMKKKNYQYRLIQNFISNNISEVAKPTIIIIPDLYKPWYTDHHIEGIIELLISFHFQEVEDLYLIATFRAPNKEKMDEIFHEKKIFGRIFSLSTIVCLFETSTKILHEIGGKMKCPLKENIVKQLEDSDNSIGKPLAAVLYCKNMRLTNQDFLKCPLTFILNSLNKMSDNECLKFSVLVKVMVHGGKVLKTVLENDTNHRLFAKSDKNSIMNCVRQLLGGYLEETNDGNSYKIIHDVITRCIFLTASKKYFNMLLQECDPYIIADCIRFKTRTERFYQWGKKLVHLETLSMGIPSESYSAIAGVLKRRKDMSDILRNVRFFDNKEFQKVWSKISVE